MCIRWYVYALATPVTAMHPRTEETVSRKEKRSALRSERVGTVATRVVAWNPLVREDAVVASIASNIATRVIN